MPSARFAALGLAGLLGTSLPAQAQTAPPLGSAASFAVLGGSAVTDTGSSIVTGNIGVSPGHTISGFAAGSVQIGAIYIDDALARQAQKDNAAAYNDLATQKCCTPSPGTTLGHGVYSLTSPLSGTLTLDAANDPHAVWIFQSATLETAANTVVRVINGGYEGNVFWQVSGSATLGAGTAFAGSILAFSDITLNDGASLSGRALSQTGTVRLHHNRVSLCCDPKDSVVLTPSTLPDATVGTQYSATTFVASGGTPPYTCSVSGLPPGLSSSGCTISGTPTAGGSFHLFVTATDSRGCHGTRDYTILANCAIVIEPQELPPTCDVHQTITANGGTPPYTFSATDLPDGVMLGPATGLLSGTPMMTGCSTVTVIVTDKNGCTASRMYTICRIEITPENLPRGVQGTLYTSPPITATGGTEPYTFSISDDLPAGLRPMGLPLTGWTITGTPATAGCSTFTVTVTDTHGFTCSRTHMICIDPCPITIAPDSLPKACVGSRYEQTITATCGTPPYTFTIDPPSPLDLTFADGVLSGVPQSAGCVDVTITVTDTNGVPATKVYQNFCSDKVIVKPDELPDAQAGVFYSQTMTGMGGEGSYTFGPAGALPCGLALASSGVVSGLPIAGCSAFFTVTATDTNGCTGKHDYQIDVNCSSVALSPSTLPAGNVGSPYSQTITATGGVPPYTFTVFSGALPPGLTLASGGTLAGTPTTVGTYCFDVGANDSPGCPATISYTIVISASTCPPGTVVVLLPPALPAAATGMPYAQLITASGGTAPYTFAVTSGALPPGLMLNSVTGLVSGTPSASGNYTLTIGATDANGCFGSMGCTVVMTVDIPVTTEWGMVMLAGLLALVGIATMRGRV